MKISTNTLTLQSGCLPRVMGVFEGSIVLFVVFSGDLPKKFFQLDGTIMTCWFSNIYVKSSFLLLAFYISVFVDLIQIFQELGILLGIYFIWILNWETEGAAWKETGGQKDGGGGLWVEGRLQEGRGASLYMYLRVGALLYKDGNSQQTRRTGGHGQEL
jgi:hypothetical protein